MFSKLDTNGDLYLEHGELAAINLDKYEVCIRPFFNSCDSYKDGKVSTAEWCLCFWRESEWGVVGWITFINPFKDNLISEDMLKQAQDDKIYSGERKVGELSSFAAAIDFFSTN